MQIKKPIRGALEILLYGIVLYSPLILYTGIGAYSNARHDAEFREGRIKYLEQQLNLNLPEDQVSNIQRELDSLRQAH